MLLLSTLIGSISWSLEGISLWLLLQGFGGTEVSKGGATLAHTSAGLLGAITLMPGGLGSTEVGTVGLLGLTRGDFRYCYACNITDQDDDSLVCNWFGSYLSDFEWSSLINLKEVIPMRRFLLG